MTHAPQRLPLFPLGSVLFPGQSLPLRIFEPRYRALVRDLLAIEEPADRLFVSVAIREGYEVGDHGVQSLYRIGCTVQLTDVEATSGGGYEVVGVVRSRFRMDGLDSSEEYAVVTGQVLDSLGPAPDDEEAAARALERYDRYVDEVSAWGEWPDEGDISPQEEVSGGQDTPAGREQRAGRTGSLPRDPEYLSWTLAARTPLPLPQRQDLLEAETTGARLRLIGDLLGAELRAMAAIPSLPATEVARTRWSPN